MCKKIKKRLSLFFYLNAIKFIRTISAIRIIYDTIIMSKFIRHLLERVLVVSIFIFLIE